MRVEDAGGLAAVHALRVVVGDVNDNPMRPGFKTVYLWKVQVRRCSAGSIVYFIVLN